MKTVVVNGVEKVTVKMNEIGTAEVTIEYAFSSWATYALGIAGTRYHKNCATGPTPLPVELWKSSSFKLFATGETPETAVLTPIGEIVANYLNTEVK